MKTTRNALFALLLLAAGTVTAASAQVSFGAGVHVGPSGRASVDLGFFYDNLAPYGNWIQRPSYGWVWTPTAVSTAWRPYENGHWVWTDQGWTWITDEPYGWATYHYGRWYLDPQIGWAWVPGDQWGPAWVSWQAGADYVGWAPLPPGVDINAGYNSGYGYGYNGGGYGGGYASYDYGIGPDAYVFVPQRYFLAPSVATYAVPTGQISAFWGQTRNYTSYRREGDRYFNQGVPVENIQRVIGRSVPRYQIADLQTTDYRQPRTRITNNQVQIFRPQVLRSAQVAPPVSRPEARRAVVSAEQFQASHPNRVTASQRAYAQQQANRAQRQQQQQQQGAQPGQVQPYQPRTYNNTQPTPDQYQTRRQRQVNPQQDQYQQQQSRRYNDQRRYQQQQEDQNNQQRPPRVVNPQQDQQRQYDNNQQQQNPDRGYRPQRGNPQQQPPPQSQGNHNGENRRQQADQPQNNGNGNGNGNGHQQQNQKNRNHRNRDRNQNQDQDQNRPPVR